MIELNENMQIGKTGKNLGDLVNCNIYSQEEQIIGTWVEDDGTKKPFYRKMIDTGAMPSNATASFAHGIANVKHIHVNLGETMWIGNSHNFSESTTYFSPIFTDSVTYIKRLYADATNINIGTGSVDAKYFKLLVCVEYTKTTD